MLLKGSCHCRAVRFSVQSHEPVPFMRCYCSICRKTAGSGGFAINLGGDFKTLKVKGREKLSVYRAKLGRGKRSPGERSFCKECGSPLWVWDPRWPDLVHPHAGAIDTPLPEAPSSAHILLNSKAGWVAVQGKRGDRAFDEFPDFSLAQWHKRHGATRSRGRQSACSATARHRRRFGGVAGGRAEQGLALAAGSVSAAFRPPASRRRT